jgi:hypothetical protein
MLIRLNPRQNLRQRMAVNAEFNRSTDPASLDLITFKRPQGRNPVLEGTYWGVICGPALSESINFVIQLDSNANPNYPLQKASSNALDTPVGSRNRGNAEVNGSAEFVWIDSNYMFPLHGPKKIEVCIPLNITRFVAIRLIKGLAM